MDVWGLVTWVIWLDVAVLIRQAASEFGFTSQKAFHLTTQNKYPTPGDEVALHCRRKNQGNTVTVGTSLLGEEDNIITWEENERSVLTTNINKRGHCTVIRDSRFITASDYQSGHDRLSATTCSFQGSNLTVSLTIKNWTPGVITGDRWRCVQFPFAESKTLEIQSYVSVTAVSIQQDIDRFSNPSRGTIVTCITSPSRPGPRVFWYIRGSGGMEVKVTQTQADLKENVETDFNGLSVTTSSILFSQDADHGTTVFCRTTNSRRFKPVISDDLVVRVKYPPSVEIQADPGASILEDTDVALHCVADGRPTPSTKWVRTEDDSSSLEGTEPNFMIISLDPILFLQSVTLKDSGKYECVASNGIGDDVTAPVFLFVREKPESAEMDESGGGESSGANDDNQESVSDKYNGALVGSVITVIAVVIIVSVIAYLFIRRKWGKHHSIVGHRPRHSLNSNNDGQAIYATCSSLSRQSELPPYVDVLPPAYRMAVINNPGYEVVDNRIDCIHGNTPRTPGGKRPLPSTPPPPNSDYGYEEIKEEERAYLNTLHRPSTTAITTNTNTTTATIDNSSNNSYNNSYNNSSSIRSDANNYISTIKTGGTNSNKQEGSSGLCDESANDNGNSYTFLSSNNNTHDDNNGLDTLQIRVGRQEYGGYEVPVLPETGK